MKERSSRLAAVIVGLTALHLLWCGDAPWINDEPICEGIAPASVLGTAVATVRTARRAASRALRGWASCLAEKHILIPPGTWRSRAKCLGRIFEVYPIKCAACGAKMEAVASIMADHELERLLKHLGLEADFPKTTSRRESRGDDAM